MPQYDPRMEEEKRRREEKIAASRASASPIQQATAGLGGQVAQGRGANPLQQAGLKVGAKLLGSALGGPLGGILGGLFNKGGKVPMPMHIPQGYNKGGWLAGLFGKGKPRTSRLFGESKKKPRTQTTAQKRNTGGAIMNPRLAGPLNPHGYNEGGAVGETPIKKVMDEQKLDQQAVAFERDQARKQEAHTMAMKQKQQQFQMAQKMKKESAVTNKKPKAPLAKK